MVMKEVPADRPVTMPLGVTEAMAGMLLAHITELLDALKGKIVKDNASVPPTASIRLLLMRLTPVTATLPLLTGSSPTSQDAQNKTITANRAVNQINFSVLFIIQHSLRLSLLFFEVTIVFLLFGIICLTRFVLLNITEHRINYVLA
jgi:hypothetical protein